MINPVKQFPRLETERLVLNKITADDISNIIKYAGDKRIADTTTNIPHPYMEEHAIYWINSVNKGFRERTQFTFAIRMRKEMEMIGAIGLNVYMIHDRAEMGYWVAFPYWRKGIATEAAGEIIRFGFRKLGLNKIFATHYEDNPASGKVMIKNGMVQEGVLKDHIKKGGQYKSLVQYRVRRVEDLK